MIENRNLVDIWLCSFKHNNIFQTICVTQPYNVSFKDFKIKEEIKKKPK